MTGGFTVLVTGATGFLGAYVIRNLAEDGHRVRPFARRGHPPGDLRNPAAIAAAIETCNVVVHLAALPAAQCDEDPALAVEVNVLGTLNVLRAAARRGICVVHVSSSHVYGSLEGMVGAATPKRPMSSYGVTKLAAEHFVELFDRRREIRAAILRFPTVYGIPLGGPAPLSIVTILTDAILSGRSLVLHGGASRELDLLHVEDAATAIRLAVRRTHTGFSVVDVADRERVTLGTIVKLVSQETGLRPVTEERQAHTGERRPWLDPASARLSLGFVPRVRPEVGIRSFVAWRMAERAGRAPIGSSAI